MRYRRGAPQPAVVSKSRSMSVSFVAARVSSVRSSRRSWIAPLSHAQLLYFEHRRARHRHSAMLRSLNRRLLQNASYVPAVNAFQRELTFVISGFEHVAMAQNTRG